ncbi:MAG: ribonuclease PH [Leptospiraceae bacterium]|nr:ribonuclease PH [Leptospiraceae bacterium]
MSARAPDQLRDFSIERSTLTPAPGCVIARFGNTRVLCTASILSDVPGWLANQDPPRGWVTAEYNMLPASTGGERKKRGTDGRSQEIQRLISRVLRAAVDLYRMPRLMIVCDCEVLSADGGTRTTAINGACVALADAIQWALEKELIPENPFLGPVAAISTGIVKQKPMLDLDYILDSSAEVDLNVAMDHNLDLIEIQGTGEQAAYSRDALNDMLDLAEQGIARILDAQKKLLGI